MDVPVRRARAALLALISVPGLALAAAFVVDSGRRWLGGG